VAGRTLEVAGFCVAFLVAVWLLPDRAGRRSPVAGRAGRLAVYAGLCLAAGVLVLGPVVARNAVG
jgi:hypothetical protein